MLCTSPDGHVRFIPTCVGNTASCCWPPTTWAVHPHVRGEHATMNNGIGYVVGSSPRAWGTPFSTHRAQVLIRFIPTCVGNTHRPRLSGTIRPVHPHVRGEHGLAAVGIEVAAGSSPRAWGTLVCTTSPSKASRFIPTCVGNTSVSARPGGPWPVHPHVRGEHASNTASSWSPSGSSPRAWGTRPWRWCWTARCRFIPTCVGNTRCRLPRSSRCSVHPHVRGEHAYLVPDADVEDGSSPRAWGTQAAAQVGRSSCRFIPTCVGNTARARGG